MLLRQLARLLVATQGMLDEADIAHQRELSDDQDPRDRKEKYGVLTYNALVKARAIIELLGGAQATRAAGFDGPTPRTPDVLADFAPKVAERLPAVATKLPAEPTVTVDFGTLVADILAPVPDLRTARADDIREAKEAEATMVNRWRKLEGHDLALRAVSGITALVMDLGGFTELAERVNAPLAVRAQRPTLTPTPLRTLAPAPRPPDRRPPAQRAMLEGLRKKNQHDQGLRTHIFLASYPRIRRSPSYSFKGARSSIDRGLPQEE